MITNIEHVGGKMICTTATGETASRKTDNQYKAAIVGRDGMGKLVVCFASWTVEKAREALAAQAAGKFVNHKFKGVTEFSLVTVDEGFQPAADPEAWKSADAKLIAARK
jgi:prophage tail gpP-like protein